MQPSYTFPSRKVYANRALGLQALINLQQVTTVPRRATDISIETGLQPSTTVPKTLDKDVFHVATVLPVVAPQYVQPGQAEGLTHVAQSQQFELQVLKVVSANNALKRGNYKSAESIMGRELTAEEITNKTVTPNVRSTEAGQKVHVGNHINAVGAQMRSGVSKEQGDFEMRFASEPFFNDLAAALNLGLSEDDALRMGIAFPVNITPGQAARLKTAFGYVGDLDFSSYGMSQSRESRARAVGGMYDAIKHHMTSTTEARREQLKMQQGMAGDLWRKNQQREQERKVHDADENDAPGEVGGADPLNDGDEDAKADVEEEADEEFEDEKAPGGPFFPQVPFQRQPAPPSQPVGVASALDAEYFGRAGAIPNVQGVFGPDVAGASRNPINRMMEPRIVPYTDPTVRDVLYPAYGNQDGRPRTEPANVLEQTINQFDLPGNRRSNGLALKIDQIEDAQRHFAEVEMKQEAKAEVEPGDDMDVSQKAVVVLDAARGRRPRGDGGPEVGQALPKFARNAESQEPQRGVKRSRTEWSRMAREHGPTKYRRTGGGLDVGALGSHHGNRRSYSKPHDRGNPYVDDRFLPDAEAYDPRGAVVSGDLMRRTGTDAMAISAQLQVPETHQWTEMPVRRFRQFPNMTEETRTELQPIAQNTSASPTVATRRRGVGRTGRVPFGRYWLDMGKLSGGVVAMTHQSTGRKIRSFPNRGTTAGLTHALNMAVTGGQIQHRRLSAHDKLYMNRLVRTSGADVDLPSDVNMPPGEQLKVLLGEIDAGNDSHDIKHQLRSVVTTLKRMKQLNPQQAGDIAEHYLKG